MLSDFSESGRSLVQRSPTACGVSNECDRETPYGEAMTQNRAEVPQKEKASRDCHGYRILALDCHSTPPPHSSYWLEKAKN